MGRRKKKSQMARREAKRVMSRYETQLSTRLERVNRVLKPRPKWFPKIVWKTLSRIFIDMKRYEELFSPIEMLAKDLNPKEDETH